MSQEARNALYAVAAGIIAVAAAAGWITADDTSELRSFVDSALGVVVVVVGLYSSVVAWWKSRPDKVTVIDVPKADVVEVVTTPGLANVDADSRPVTEG